MRISVLFECILLSEAELPVITGGLFFYLSLSGDTEYLMEGRPGVDAFE